MDNDYERSAKETARVGDLLITEREELFGDASGMHGLLVIERFTALPGMDLGRPQELLARKRLLLSDLDVAEEMANIDAELADLLSERIVVPNLITQIGDQYYGERASGIVGAPAQATGMKLGTGSTAVAKTGAGAALDTYLSASNKLFDGGYPASSLNGSARQIQWRASWAAGDVDGPALREVVIVNDAAVDATSTASNTYSRALFGPITLGASDTLSITWNHLLEGTP